MVIIIGFNITAFGREIKLFEREPAFPLSVRMSRVLLFPIDRALVCISPCAGVLFPLFCSLCPTFSLESESESESEMFLFDPYQKYIKSNNATILDQGTPIKTSLVANIRAAYYIINNYLFISQAKIT